MDIDSGHGSEHAEMPHSYERVPLKDALDPLVLALDVGSTACRGDVYDAAGRPVEGRRQKISHEFRTAGDGTSEIDPDQVTGELELILDARATARLRGRIRGVALDTFASSLVGVDADDQAVTSCYTYADSRCGFQTTAMRASSNERAIQQRTGSRLHSSYLAPRLRWLRETDPGRFGAATRWMSLGEYVYLKLLGTTAAGTSTAAWSGLLNRHTGEWDAEMLALAGIDVSQLSEVRDPDRPLTEVDPGVVDRWPALADVAWFPPIADGFASNLGTGASNETMAALAAGTSGAIRVLMHEIPAEVSPGLWCYRMDSRRSLVGGAVNDVGRTVSWAQRTLDLGLADIDELMSAAPDASTPLMLPYLSGERAPGWADDARAVIAGVSSHTTGPVLFRAAMEGVALTYARVGDHLRASDANPQRLLASGRVTQNLPAWLHVVAEVLGITVEPITIKRATLRGTALQALEVLAPDTPRSAPTAGPILEPVAEHAAYYRDRAEAYQDMYAAVIEDHSPKI